MSKYKPHGGYFYSDIGDGFNYKKIDFCFILPEKSNRAIMILKCNIEVAAYDFHELLEKREYAKLLNYKKFLSPDLAYSKMMKWIGKMIKKSYELEDGHISRYYNNKQDDVKYLSPPTFILSKEMNKVYNWMENNNF